MVTGMTMVREPVSPVDSGSGGAAWGEATGDEAGGTFGKGDIGRTVCLRSLRAGAVLIPSGRRCYAFQRQLWSWHMLVFSDWGREHGTLSYSERGSYFGCDGFSYDCACGGVETPVDAEVHAAVLVLLHALS